MDLLVSQRSGGSWQNPTNLGATINSSADDMGVNIWGNTLFFHSTRLGGWGGCDIYWSVYDSVSWGSPQNLGSPVNTSYDERWPCFSNDGRTMYLDSDGPGGRGSFDLWLAERSYVTLGIAPATLEANTTGNIIYFNQDNPDDEVAALQVDILFDTDCFSVTDVTKTIRTEMFDSFSYSHIHGGIRIASMDYTIMVDFGTGPIAGIEVDVADCVEMDYVFDVTGCVVADPLGVEIPCVEVDNWIHVSAPECILSVDPASIDFGDVRVCNPAYETVEVCNAETAPCDVVADPTGCASVDPAAFVLDPGACRNVTVDCHPTAEGPCEGTVVFTGGDNPVEVAVTCNGVCSHIQTNCPLDFGTVFVAVISFGTLTVTNTGSANLNISAIQFDVAWFSHGELPGPILPGDTALITISATPAAPTGPFTAKATIVSDACEGEVICELTMDVQLGCSPPTVEWNGEPAPRKLIRELKECHTESFRIRSTPNGIVCEEDTMRVWAETNENSPHPYPCPWSEGATFDTVVGIGTVESGGSWHPYCWGSCDSVIVDFIASMDVTPSQSVSSTLSVYFFVEESDNPCSIAITTPEGGESWSPGEEQLISWESNNSSDNVKIEYSTDAGTNWLSIIEEVTNTGSYIWLIPNTPSSECLVRVIDDQCPFCLGVSGMFAIPVCCECGDCNEDGSVNILDALWEVNCILGIIPPPCSCDCNRDGRDNVLDVLCVVNLILGGFCP